MTMTWMETVRYIGLDLQLATVLALTSIDVAGRAFTTTWRRRRSGTA